MPDLIGLHGRMGSGKDAAFRIIATWHECRGMTAERVAFADKLKVSAARALGGVGSVEECVAFCNELKEVGHVKIELPDRGTNTITGRQYLQWYGTEAHREVFDTDFWINAILPNRPWDLAERYPSDTLVITDVRFPNEAQRILDLEGEVWCIDADERQGINAETHGSEVRLDPSLITKTIKNNGTMFSFSESISEEL